MSDPLSPNGDALSAYRYAALGQAGIAITFEQLLDQQSQGRHQHQSQGQNTTGTAAGVDDTVSISVSPASTMTQAQSILQRMRSLSFQAASGTSTSGASTQIQQELSRLQGQLDELAATTRTAKPADASVKQAKDEAAKVADDVQRKKTAAQQAAKKDADKKAASLVSGDHAKDAVPTSGSTKNDKTGAADDPDAIADADDAETAVAAARGQLSDAARAALSHSSVTASAAEALLRG